jgi:RNA polymerase sigma-70 factor, ECF subfamily
MESQELTIRMVEPHFVANNALTADDFSQLVKRAVEGDMAAFEQIVALHERRVLMTALHVLGSLHDAQDAAQEVLIRLYRHLDRFDQSRDMLPWLYRITVNVCRDLQKRGYRNRTLDLTEARGVKASADLEGEIIREEQREQIQEALSSLPEKEKTALVLRDIQGLSTKDVALILRSSEGTVRSQVSMARLRIKRFIEQRVKRQV